MEMRLTHPGESIISNNIEIKELSMSTIKRLFPALAGLFGKRLELCCPGGVRSETVEQLRRDGLHFGRLR